MRNARVWTRSLVLGTALTALTLTAVLAIACEDVDSEEDPTPVTTWKITPAAPRSPTVAPTAPAATPTPSPDETPAARAELTLTGVSNTFLESELEAPAGPITIVFNNRDAGIVHNVHIFRGENAQGEDVGATELEVGPIEQTLDLDLEAGEYFYQCDAHPTTMSGRLTVT